MAPACAAADVVISERWLPRECVGRWLTVDRDTLAESGGLALYLGARPHAVAARRPGDEHPWRQPPRVSGNAAAVPKAPLARCRPRPRSVAAHRPCWRGRGGSSGLRGGNV